MTERYTPFMAYLSKELGVKVKLRIAKDYAAVIEGQRAGNIHIANYGSASFARARMTGVKTEAFAIDVNGDGSKGYYSVFYVKAKQPLPEDRGSEGQEPRPRRSELDLGQQRAALRARQDGHRPRHSSSRKVVYAGSHENAILALAQGTVDVAANWWTSETTPPCCRCSPRAC